MLRNPCAAVAFNWGELIPSHSRPFQAIPSLQDARHPPSLERPRVQQFRSALLDATGGATMAEFSLGLRPPSSLELLRIVPLPEAAYLSGVDEDELRREFPDKIIELGNGRQGLRALYALRLTMALREPGGR